MSITCLFMKTLMYLIKEKKQLIQCLLIIMIFGTLTGIFCYYYQSSQSMLEYSSAFISTLVVPNNQLEFFIGQFVTNMLLVLLIFSQGFSIIGIPIIYLCAFIKGFQIGFSAALFIFTYQLKGILGIIITLIPQVILDCIPIFIISIISIELCILIIHRVNNGNKVNKLLPIVNKKLNALFICIILILIICLIKSVVIVKLMEIFALIQ